MNEDEVEEIPRPAPITNEQEFHARLRRYADLAQEVEGKEAELKDLKASAEALSYSLAQYMMAASITSIVIDGKLFKQKQRVFSKVEDKEALRQWIRDNDAVDLLMSVHSSKLTAYCNEQLEAGGTTPAGVNPNFIKYSVSIK